jgi:hypothetical protein
MASGLKTNQDWINEVINDFSDLETINKPANLFFFG